MEANVPVSGRERRRDPRGALLVLLALAVVALLPGLWAEEALPPPDDGMPPPEEDRYATEPTLEGSAVEPTAEPQPTAEEDRWASMTYEPIPADPMLFSEDVPRDEGLWEPLLSTWERTYDGWAPVDSDWALLQSEWEQSVTVSPDEPEPDLNCDVLIFPRMGCVAVQQNDGHGDLWRTAQLRRLTKVFFRRAVLQSRGLIHELWRSGRLFGLEFDWFHVTGNEPDPDAVLPVVGQVFGLDDEGLPLLLANVWCYDAAGFAARRRTIEARIQHPMDEYVVWIDNTVSAVGDKDGFKLTGGVGLVNGPSASLADVVVAGGYHHLDEIAYAEDLRLRSTQSVGSATRVTAITAPAPPCDVGLARVIANFFGTYHPGKARYRASEPPPEGFVFAEGDLEVEASGLRGSWTFVSAKGRIRLRGVDLDASGWMADTVAIAYDGDVEVHAARCRIAGAVHAPQGKVKMNGSGVKLEGIVSAETLEVSGGFAQVTDGTEPKPLPIH
jgi:hypothetical protein